MFVRSLENRITPTVNWTGNAGDSQWTTPNNWSPVGVPGAGADVVINSAVNIFYAGAGTTIQSLSLQAGYLYVDASSMNVTSGLTISPGYQIHARNAGSSFTASGATTMDGGNAYAQSSATVTLNGLTAVTANASYATYLEADGGGVLNAPNLTSITGTNSTQFVYVEARSGGTVNMNGVTTLNSGSTELNAADAGSVINANALKTVDFNTATDSYGNLYATGGGQVHVSAMLTKINHINFHVEGAASFPTSQLTSITLSTVYVYGGNPSFANVTSLTGSSFYAQGGSMVTFTNLASTTGSATYSTFLQADSASSLSFPALTTVNLNPSIGYFTYIRALSGSTVTLGALTKLDTGYVDLLAQDAGSKLNMPQLASVTFPTGSYGNITAQSGGQMAVAVSFNKLNSLNFTIDAANAFPVGQLASSSGSNIYINGGSPVFTNFTKFDILPSGYITLRAQNAGTVASFPAMTTFAAGIGSFDYLQALSGSKLSAPLLTSISGGYSYLQADGASSVLDLPGLASVSFPAGYYGYINVQNGGKMNVAAGLKTLDSENFYLDSSTGFPVGQLTSITNSNVYLYGGSPSFTNLASATNCRLEADYAGTVASFPALTNFISNPATNFSYLLAYSGATLSAAALTTLNTGNVQLQARNAGSVLNLPALASIVFPNVGGYQTYGYIYATGGGQIKVAAGLTTLDEENLYQDTTTGFPVGQLTSITNSNVYIQGGTPTFTNLTKATNCRLQTENAGTVASYPALTNFISNPVSTFTYLLAYSGATLSAPALTTLNTGNVQLQAQNAGSVLNLSALSSIVFPLVSGYQTYGYIYATGGGQIKVAAGLTTLDEENLYQDTTTGFPVGQLTSITNSNVYIQGGTPTFTNLASVTNSRLEADYAGTAASFPALVNFISNPYSTFSYLVASQGATLSAAALTTLNSGNVQLLSQYAGSVLNLPALSSIVFPLVSGYQTYGYIYATSGGQIKVAAGLTTLDQENFYQDTTAGFPVGQLTSISNSNVYIQGGSPTFTNLTKATNCRLEADYSGTVASFPALTNFTNNSGYSYMNAFYSAKLSAPALTTINTGSVQLQAYYGSYVGVLPSILDLPALTTFTPPVGSYGYVYATQYNTQINTAANLHLANLQLQFDDQATFNFSNLQLDSNVTTTGFGKLPGNVTNDGYLDTVYYVPHELEIGGNYTQTSTGTLRVDLYGLTQGTQYDWLKVDGTASLNGTLTVQYDYGYTPLLGNSYIPVSATSLSGKFINYNNLLIGGGLELSPTYNGTSFILTAVVSTGPYVTGFVPTGTVFAAVDHVDVTFNKDIITSSVTAAEVVVTGPGGPYTLTGISPLGGSSYRIYLPTLVTSGTYTVNIGPDITSLAGTKMDQNQNGTFGENPADTFAANFTIATDDLIVQSIGMIPANANFGQTFNVPYVAKNIGNAATPNGAGWLDYVYLSNDNVLDGGDTYIGNGNGAGSPVAPNGTYNGNATVTLPLVPTRPDGNYYLIVLANANGGLTETNTANNNLTSPVIALKTPPRVVSYSVNNGVAQRSMVNTVSVTFNEVVTLPGNAANAFSLQRLSPGAPNGFVGLVASNVDNTGGQTKVTLTFQNGTLYNGISLIDGRYQLKALAAQITDATGLNLDGDANGITGDDYATNGVHRIFGDVDGDASVSAADFIQFRLSFGGVNPLFDFDGDGAVAASDFIQFRLRFGGSV